MAHESGLSTQPDVVAELGPGDSLGVGLAALISGANQYFALDVMSYASNERNLEVFDGIVELFSQRETIPDERELPSVKPYLESYEFPAYILTQSRLQQAMGEHRIASIRESLSQLGSGGQSTAHVAYVSDWYDFAVIEQSSIDMVFSQAVFEHVEDLRNTYEALRLWLKPGGVMSHQIDFKSHKTANTWDGHWTYSDFTWKLVKGTRTYLINRQPHSAHVDALEELDFDILADIKVESAADITRSQLSTRFKHLSDDDLTTSGAFIQSVCSKD